MDRISLTTFLLIGVGAGFVLAALAWPLWRHYRRTGELGLTVHRRGEPLERLVAGLMALLIVGLGLWVGLYAAQGPVPLGVWRVSVGFAGVGAVVMLLSLVLVVVAQAQMGTSWRIGIEEGSTALVQTGLFGWVRNPIYTGLVLLLGGLALVTPSPWTVAAVIVGAATVALQARLEERHLLKQHGEGFRRYAARVGRFLPGVGRLAC